MTKTIKLKIDNFDDRRQLTAILADNRYKVMVETVPTLYNTATFYYVYIELEND